MKIIFLLHSELDSNSGYQADIIASKLGGLGHEVLIVHAGAVSVSDPPDFRVLTHLDFFTNTAVHLRDFAPEVVVAWTPREIVRLLWDKLVREGFGNSKLVIHFEDNEALLAEQCQPEMIATRSNLGFFDPERGAAFVEKADGFTFVTESIKELVASEGRPIFILTAPYDDRLFAPAPRNDSWRRDRRIADDALVIVYTGNAHRLNRGDMQMLYEAVDLIGRNRPVLLIRTGTGIAIAGAEGHVLDLGVVSRSEMPGILAAADLYIQPGRPGPFDNFRFPSKIPEMAVTGRPLICPDLPCLSDFVDREEVFKCEMEDANAISEAVNEVISAPGLARELGAGSVRAAHRECDPARTAPALGAFYHELSTSGV